MEHRGYNIQYVEKENLTIDQALSLAKELNQKAIDPTNGLMNGDGIPYCYQIIED